MSGNGQQQSNETESYIQNVLIPSGATDAQIQEFRRTFVPVSAYTQARQRDSQEVQSVLQQHQQGGQGNGSAQQSTLADREAALHKQMEEIGIGEGGQKMLRELQEIAEIRAIARMRDEIAPVMRPVYQHTLNSQTDQAHSKLIAELGDEANQYWPEILPVVQQYVAAGQPVDPKAVLMNANPEAFQSLYTKHVASQNQQKKEALSQSSTEGFARQQPGRPLESQSTEESGKAGAPPDRWAELRDIVASADEEVEKRMGALGVT